MDVHIADLQRAGAGAVIRLKEELAAKYPFYNNFAENPDYRTPDGSAAQRRATGLLIHQADSDSAF